MTTSERNVVEHPSSDKPQAKPNYELRGIILGAAVGSVLGAVTGQLWIWLAVCIGAGWLGGLLLGYRKQKNP